MIQYKLTRWTGLAARHQPLLQTALSSLPRPPSLPPSPPVFVILAAHFQLGHGVLERLGPPVPLQELTINYSGVASQTS